MTKAILAILIEKGIEILLNKECKKIKNIKINICSSNSEIIKGNINQVKISAKEVNYKELLFNQIELQTNKLRVKYQIINRKLDFKDRFKAKIKISLTEESLKKTLNSHNWDWLGGLISETLLNSSQLTDLRIENNIIELKGSKRNNSNLQTELFEIKSKDGKINLRNINNMHSMTIPIEDKIYINHINIVENKININAQVEVNI